MSSREIWIKKHRRLTPSGKEINVKGHHRRIENRAATKMMSSARGKAVQCFNCKTIQKDSDYCVECGLSLKGTNRVVGERIIPPEELEDW